MGQSAQHRQICELQGAILTNGVIYARYSSHNQREESIEGQLRECKAYAEREKITVTGEYIDRAISGKTDNRASFQKMIKDAEKGQFSVVIVYKLDRFARNRYDSAIYKARLARSGVRVVSAMEAILDSPEGIILESVLEGMAEYYSANLAQNIKRGMVENARKCLATGGGRCLGYVTGPDKKYQIEPKGADTVRYIYELYDQGHTYKQIVDILNDQGRRTYTGNSFNKNSLSKILHNRRYVGDFVWSDIIIPGGMPQIVDRDLWERVQEKLKTKENAQSRQRGEYEYLLSGKLFCGRCGNGMIGDQGTSRNGKKHYYYSCSTKKHGGDCRKKSVRAWVIEDEVIRATVEQILRDEILEYIADRVMEYQERDSETSAILTAYREQLKEAQDSINGLMKAIEAGLYTDDMKARMEELAAKKADIHAKIQRAEQENVGVTHDEILFFLSQFKDGDINDINYRRRLIKTFVNSVWLYDDKIVITYNYSGDKNKVTLDMVNTALADAGIAECSNLVTLSPPQGTRTNMMFVRVFLFAWVFRYVIGME